jgi:hypothetical protein
MLKAMRNLPRLFTVMLTTAGLCAGCVSLTPAKFEEQVHQWVPIGTRESEAKKIMEHKDFECTLVKKDNPFNQIGTDYLDCTRTQVWFHDWTARIIFKDGMVSDYGYIHVE